MAGNSSDTCRSAQLVVGLLVDLSDHSVIENTDVRRVNIESSRVSMPVSYMDSDGRDIELSSATRKGKANRPS